MLIHAIVRTLPWSLLVACGGPVPEQAADAVVDSSEDVEDAYVGDDLTTDEVASDRFIGHRYQLADGRVVSGELVASYDQTRWVAFAATRTLAVFDPERFAPWPDDRSLTFVDAGDVISDVEVLLPPGRVRYRDWLSAKGIGVARVPLDEPALVISAHEDHHLKENGYGDFAWDLVFSDGAGERFHGDGTALADYLIWDAPVVAPVAGDVVELVGDAPDIPPGALPADGLDAAENLVGIRIAGAYHAYVLHLRAGSLVPVLGARVAPGEPLGRVGNSGTTLEPHLHLVVLYWDFERARFWSVPVDCFQLWRARGPDGATLFSADDPQRGDWINSSEF